jgi:hypothetical protein
MSVKFVQVSTTGLVPNVSGGGVGMTQQSPTIIYINTDDSLATVLTTGYLNQSKIDFQVPYNNYQMALVYTTDQGNVWLRVLVSGTNYSLESTSAAGTVALPTVANQIVYATNVDGALAASGVATALFNAGNISAGLSGTAGTLVSYPATAARGSLRLTAANSAGDTITTITNASMAAARTFTIPDGGQTASSFLITDSAGTQTIATGSLALTLGNLTVAAGNIAATLGSVAAGTTVTGGTGVIATTGNVTASAGNVVAGAAGAAGTVTSFSGTGANEFLRLAAVDNAGGDFSTTISNATSVGQSQVISIPDAGAATANFLLDTGTSNIISHQQFMGIPDVLTFGTGTWTVTRIAQGDYVSRHTPGDETSIIGIDITPAIRVAASKGFRLDSFDVIYGIAANALDAHSVTLNRVVYANNVAVSVTAVAITGVLATATQANPYVTNVAVDVPAFLVTADSKYVIEVTVDNAAASEYDWYGIMLRFSQTIG